MSDDFKMSQEGVKFAQENLISFLKKREEDSRRRTGKGLSSERRKVLKEAFNKGLSSDTGIEPKFKKRSGIGKTFKDTLQR